MEKELALVLALVLALESVTEWVFENVQVWVWV
jgi:hypothetical protein